MYFSFPPPTFIAYSKVFSYFFLPARREGAEEVIFNWKSGAIVIWRPKSLKNISFVPDTSVVEKKNWREGDHFRGMVLMFELDFKKWSGIRSINGGEREKYTFIVRVHGLYYLFIYIFLFWRLILRITQFAISSKKNTQKA